MKQKVAPGAVFDFATPGEVKEHLDSITQNFYREKSRGIALWRAEDDEAVANDSVTIPAQGSEPMGPNPGYACLVQSARVYGLATGDVILIYRNAVVPRNFVGQLTFAAPFTGFGSKGLILKGGEKLTFTGSNLMATDVAVNVEGIEVPEPDIYKLVSP